MDDEKIFDEKGGQKEERVFCSNCGEEIGSSVTYCSYCGASHNERRTFCSRCGKKIGTDAAFCPYCGKEHRVNAGFFANKIGSAISAIGDKAEAGVTNLGNVVSEKYKEYSGRNPGNAGASYYAGDHPYHRLGGWLAFLAYGQLIGGMGIAVSSIVLIIRLFPYLRYGKSLVALGVFVIIFCIAAAWFCIKMFNMIRTKNPQFLRFYEKWLLITLATIILLAVTNKLYFGYFYSLSNGVASVIEVIIGFIVWTTYFRKSVRVRTYFGTDEYLKQSIFFKNCIAPEPID